jgi:hypothetical protein
VFAAIRRASSFVSIFAVDRRPGGSHAGFTRRGSRAGHMVGEAFAGLGAIRTDFDIAKGLKDIDDAARRNAAVIELQENPLRTTCAIDAG